MFDDMPREDVVATVDRMVEEMLLHGQYTKAARGCHRAGAGAFGHGDLHG